MLAAFKEVRFSYQILLATLLLFVVSVGYGGEDHSSELDTMSVFHEGETRAEVIKDFGVDSSDQRLHFEVYFVNSHGEPYSEPIHLIIGYQYDGEDFRRIDRKFDGQSEPTYCQFGEPQVMQREVFAQELGLDLETIESGHTLSQEGEYLVVPVYNYSEDLGDCELTKAEFEVFSIEGLKNKHQGEASDRH